jgi:1,4-dihydroxy-2-naphthoyl-CoA hydrolase
MTPGRGGQRGYSAPRIRRAGVSRGAFARCAVPERLVETLSHLSGGTADPDLKGADGGTARPVRCAAVPDDHVAWLNEFFRPKVPGMFGCEITNVSPEGAEGRLTVTEPLIAGTGFVFAPVVIGMADFLCAAAIGPHLPVKTNFVSSAREGDVVTGEARPVHLGRTTQVWDATVTNATTGRLMALFRNTQLVLLPRQ